MKLNYRRTFLIGLAFMSISAFWQFYDQVIPFICENTFGINTFYTNAIMSIDNVLALFMLPLFGALSDRTHTALGRRTPYIAIGTAVSCLALAAMAAAQRSVRFPLFLGSLLLLLTAMSTYRSPAVALMPDLTPKPLRSKGNAVINLMGALGGIYALAMMMLLLRSEAAADGSSSYAADQSFTGIFLAMILFMALCIILQMLTVHENAVVKTLPPESEEEQKEESHNGKLPRDMRRSLLFLLCSVFFWYMAYNAVTTAFSRYCSDVLNAGLGASSGYLLAATAVATLSYLPLGILSGKLGRKRTILLGVALMTICYGAVFFLHHASPLLYILFGLIGIGWAAINVNSFPMVVEMSGAGDVGRFTGYYYTFSMAAQIATPLLSGLLITRLPSGYRTLFPYAVCFSLAALLTMTQVRHGDVRPAAKDSLLEHFDAGD